MRNPKIPAHLVDETGYIWASGEMTFPKITKLIKVYHSAGIELTLKAVI